MKSNTFIRNLRNQAYGHYPLPYLGGEIRIGGYLVSQLWLMSSI